MERYGAEHLLLGLLEDATGVVERAFAGVGVSVQDVRSRAGSPLPVGSGVRGDRVQPCPEVDSIEERALVLAASREHLVVEPGHLLHAIASELGSSACGILIDLGADLMGLQLRLDELLPTKTIDELTLWKQVRPEPLASEVERSSNASVRVERRGEILRSEGEAVTPSERARLERIVDETDWARAMIDLQMKLTYLYWELAKSYAAAGHNLAYVFNLACNPGFQGALFSYTLSNPEPFTDYARRFSESRWPRPCVGVPRGRSEALDRCTQAGH